MTVSMTANERFLPYGRQSITDDDIRIVTDVLRSDWLTQGPKVPEFENALARELGSSDAIVCVNGTAALHLSMLALGIGPGDVVVTTPNTFVASANCARYVGADVRFADIDAATGLMDIACLQDLLAEDTKQRIKLILPVHFAGQPIDLPRIWELAKAHGALVVDDACHAIGGEYEHAGMRCRIGDGKHSQLTVFSFHPVKHVATGEGGAVTTNDSELAERLRSFRNHGMVRDNEHFNQKEMAQSDSGEQNPWYHEMQHLGYNYRLTDLQAALGISQLSRLKGSVSRRNEIAKTYHKIIGETGLLEIVKPLKLLPCRTNAYHLFVVQIDFDSLKISRAVVMNRLRESGIGTQVHYIPVHLQPYYRRHSGTGPGDFPQAEAYYARALSLPMYPDLNEDDIERVILSLRDILEPAS